jgi:hypothetical protein
VEFVHGEGVTAVIAALKQHGEYLVADVYRTPAGGGKDGLKDGKDGVKDGKDTEEEDTFYQAVALLYNVLLPDSQAKMNLAQVRQAALHSGLVDLAQGIQRRYKGHENLTNMVSFLLTILMQDHS